LRGSGDSLIFRLTVLALAAALVAALAAVSPARALPPAGTDVIAATGQVSVVTVLGSESISVSGTATIQHGTAYMEGGVEVVDTEITALSLAGQSLTGTVTISESATLASTGELRGVYPPPVPWPASSFFDVFVVVQAPASPSPTITLHNDQALHMVPMAGGEETYIGWPPQGDVFVADTTPCVPLLPSLPKQACITGLSIMLGVPPVGGIAGAPDVALPSGGGAPLAIAALAAGAALLALAGAAWLLGRRRASSASGSC
jgi:hypothetical protein